MLPFLGKSGLGLLESRISGKGQASQGLVAERMCVRHVSAPGCKLAPFLTVSQGLHELCKVMPGRMHDQRFQDAAACGVCRSLQLLASQFFERIAHLYSKH